LDKGWYWTWLNKFKYNQPQADGIKNKER
jgi:hypothetical protein